MGWYLATVVMGVCACFANSSFSTSSSIQCDVIIAGGSTAALSAAISAARDSPDLNICLTEPTDWLGGQLTSAGVPAIDFGDRNEASKYQAGDFVDMLASLGTGNPGNCWVSTKCYLPKNLINNWIKDTAASLENLTVLYNTVVKNVTVKNRTLVKVTGVQRFARPGTSPLKRRYSEVIEDWYSTKDSELFTKRIVQLVPTPDANPVVIDATEFGDVLVLSNASFHQGVESPYETSRYTSDTCGQAFTFPFFMKLFNHSVPGGYWPNFTSPYYLLGEDWDSIWSYRRVLATPGPMHQARPGEISNQNWGTGNDYRNGYMLLSFSDTVEQRADWRGGLNLDAISAAELQAYGWYWYYRQNAPTNVRNRLALEPSVAGTENGLSKIPYLRDSRRSVGNGDFMLTKSDLTFYYKRRLGLNFTDSIALGDYFYADIHGIFNCIYPDYVNQPNISAYTIPFRALTNKDFDNLLVAGKTMAQTFMANAATRLHPMEWGTGLSAGLAAAMMSRDRLSTSDVSDQIVRLQRKVRKYMPIFWS